MVTNLLNYSRFQICEALDTPEVDNIGEPALNERGETFVMLNHWKIYRWYAEVLHVYPIAESKYWLLYEVGASLAKEDALWDMLSEDDCIPYEGYGDTYDNLMRKFLRSDAIDLLELNWKI